MEPLRDRRIELKVKIKSLAAEARIIRLEEKRTKDNLKREQLYLHRIGKVRECARYAQLAYGYIRGRKRSELEGFNSKPISTPRLLEEVRRFGPPIAIGEQGMNNWLYQEWYESVA